MKRISEVIAELQRILAEHGDVRCYCFDEYSTAAEDKMQVEVAFVAVPHAWDRIKEPHVQFAP
jgi:hypothetical protein